MPDYLYTRLPFGAEFMIEFNSLTRGPTWFFHRRKPGHLDVWFGETRIYLSWRTRHRTDKL